MKLNVTIVRGVGITRGRIKDWWRKLVVELGIASQVLGVTWLRRSMFFSQQAKSVRHSNCLEHSKPDSKIINNQEQHRPVLERVI